jgi:hypothetical protein
MICDATLPARNDPRLKSAMDILGCNNVAVVPIVQKPHTRVNRCHANVELYVAMYGGKKLTGYYMAVSASEDKWIAIKHSVWNNNGIIDITPVDDDRTHNVFVWGNDRLFTDVYSNCNQINYNEKVIYEDTFAGFKL